MRLAQLSSIEVHVEVKDGSAFLFIYGKPLAGFLEGMGFVRVFTEDCTKANNGRIDAWINNRERLLDLTYRLPQTEWPIEDLEAMSDGWRPANAKRRVAGGARGSKGNRRVSV